MNTIVDKVNALDQTKQAIKQSLINKGVAIADSDTFRSYANKVNDIKGGDPNCNVFIEGNNSVTGYDALYSQANYVFKNSVKEADIKDFNNLSITRLIRTFSEMKLYNADDKTFPNIINFDMVFKSAKTEKDGSLILRNWSLPACTGMDSPFSYTYNFKLINWNVPLLNNVKGLFDGCSGNIDISGFPLNTITRADNISGTSINNKDINIIFPDNCFESLDSNALLDFSKLYNWNVESIRDLSNKIGKTTNKIYIRYRQTISIPSDVRNTFTNKGWTLQAY